MDPVEIEAGLRSILPEEAVLAGVPAPYLRDATEGRGLLGRADAVVTPGSTREVCAALAWCYERGVAVVPRGGGTGFAGGAVPDGGVVLSLERMRSVRSFEPAAWRISVEAGLTTAELRRLARESGLLFPPDPGAAEQSQVGGNVATNAGGPHTLKYGTTRAWVTGIEAVVPPGEAIVVGGPISKDVAGYDLVGLLTGSEGTLGVITAADIRLVPAPEASLPVCAFYEHVEQGCEAIAGILGAGLRPAALEYLDAGALRPSARGFPTEVPPAAGFLVIADADGSEPEAARLAAELHRVLAPGSLALHAPRDRRDAARLWGWRDGVSLAVSARRGGKVSEDIVVPVERLGEAISGTHAIGRRHGLETCSWGHAGDGNLHSTFLVDPTYPADLDRAAEAAGDLFDLALRLGGSISGEHGTGIAKRGRLAGQWDPHAVDLHEGIKRLFDPRGLLNPGKKEARAAGRPPVEGA